MSLAVVDASVLVVFYAVDDSRHALVAEHLRAGDRLFAPAHLDAERLRTPRTGAPQQGPGPDHQEALTHLDGFPIPRMPLPPLLERMWELRDNVTPYAAANIAMAERLDAALVTSDARLVTAKGHTCTFGVIE